LLARLRDPTGVTRSMKTISIGLLVAMFAYACAPNAPSTQSPGGGSHAHKSSPKKGSEARDSGQHVGGHATHDRSRGNDRGASYEDLTCDQSDEGLAWCDSDTELVFCSGGEWWSLDCAHPDINGDFCGDEGTTVDCFATAEID
jgi:hypothetical protein